jgi:hypothetical protein
MDAAMEAVPRCFQQELRKRPELQQFVKKRTRYLTYSLTVEKLFPEILWLPSSC